MALSGTLDSFALPDVLRLLASTRKTGRLRVTGDRGSGSVWVEDGEVVSTQLSSPGSPDPSSAEVVFGLLRFASGSFTFEAEARPASSSEAEALEPILVTAEHMLLEWRSIEEIVPSLDVWVSLAPEPGGGDVMIDAARWRCISAVGGGGTANDVGAALGQSELDACRTIKELVELGLLVVGDAPSSTTPPVEKPEASATAMSLDRDDEVEPIEPEADPADTSTGDWTGPDTTTPTDSELVDEIGHYGGSDSDHGSLATPIDEPGRLADPEPLITTTPGLARLDPETELPSMTSDEPGRHAYEGELTAPAAPFDSFADAVGAADPIMAESTAGPVPDAFGGTADPDPVTGGIGSMFGAASLDEDTDTDLDPAEMARQLANLSPKAAKAVAAAAKASTEAEREAALAAVEAEDDTVNRGLLLKFLGSVDG